MKQFNSRRRQETIAATQERAPYGDPRAWPHYHEAYPGSDSWNRRYLRRAACSNKKLAQLPLTSTLRPGIVHTSPSK